MMMSFVLRLGCCKIQETSAAVERLDPCSQLYSKMRLYMGDNAYPLSIPRRRFPELSGWALTDVGEIVEMGTSELEG